MRSGIDEWDLGTDYFIAPGGCSTILSNVLDALHHSENAHVTHKRTHKTIVSHIHSAACQNMVALMKALVIGFVDHYDHADEEQDDLLGRTLVVLVFSPLVLL